MVNRWSNATMLLVLFTLALLGVLVYNGVQHGFGMLLLLELGLAVLILILEIFL